MKGSIPTLSDAEWLVRPEVQQVFAALEQDHDEARIVGGAVRDALLGKAVGDIDFATTALPEAVMQRARSAGFKVVPTGIDHGTVTVIATGTGYEVTTLREDVETDGRRAIVRFGRDWLTDARRRDFTVNALSVDRIGTVHDPIGGYSDIAAHRIRFIGDPDRRITEDRLRILRLFRLHAEHGRGDLDRAALAASIRAREGLRDLSAERIGHEMRRLVVAPLAPATLVVMQESGILPIVLGGVGYIATFSRVTAFEAVVDVSPAMPLRLAALGCKVEEDVERLTLRLRLSNAERDRMLRGLVAARMLIPRPDGRGGRSALYRLGSGRSATVLRWRSPLRRPRPTTLVGASSIGSRTAGASPHSRSAAAMWSTPASSAGRPSDACFARSRIGGSSAILRPTSRRSAPGCSR